MRTRLAILNALGPLIGLQLSLVRNAADMKNFAFGAIRPHPNGRGGTVGEYALHVQCPWRITSSLGIVTGSSDQFGTFTTDVPADDSDWVKNSLQDRNLKDLFGGVDPDTRSVLNIGNSLVVDEIDSDHCGSFELKLSGGYALEVFPDSSCNESWRLFKPGTDEHFIFAGSAS